MKHLQKFIASALLAMVSTIMCAQKIEVSGTVVDPNGETIIGASIMEKGTSNGTVTDFDGNFKLTTASGAKIVVSYIGFMTQELNAEPTMKIVLKEDAQSLQEVVVTGYTTQRKAPDWCRIGGERWRVAEAKREQPHQGSSRSCPWHEYLC